MSAEYLAQVEVAVLREALIECAEIAGVDGEAIAAARSGAMKYPSVAKFAISAVEQLRADYDDSLADDMLKGDKP